MRKIDLDNVKNVRKFKDLALLFDNPKFQKELEKIVKQNKEDGIKYPDLASQLLNSNATAYDMARDLVKKYKYPIGFTRAVFTGATLGKVTDNDVIDCYSKAIMNPLSYLDTYTPTLTREDLVIVVDPHSINRNKGAIKKDIKVLLDAAALTIIPLPKDHPLTKDVGLKIKRFREWYWLNKTKGYKKLSKELRINVETFRSGIRYYRGLLKYRV